MLLYLQTIVSNFTKSEKHYFLQMFSMYRLERMDWQDQAELLKQQTLTTLSEKDQQVRQLTTMLEEARSSKLRLDHTQRQVKSSSLIFKYETLKAA